MDPNQLVRGHVFHHRYVVERVLGVGGMGVVYEVVDRNTERSRALKVMLPTIVAKEELRRRFRQEATIGGKIESEHIAEVVDAGIEEASGAPFIVLELLKGEEIGARLVREGAFARGEVLVLLKQAALGFEKAHAAGVVHRDLKPENLFVTYRDDGSPRIKILDFGIAKIVSASMSDPQTRGIIGSPLYMAPEQVTGQKEISPQSDIYAMGHVAYHMLVGEPYWQVELDAHEGVYPLLMQIAEGAPEAASERALRAGVALGPAFDAWFEKSIAPAPRDRFESVTAQIEALEAALGEVDAAPSLRPRTVVAEPVLTTSSGSAVARTIAGEPQIAPGPTAQKRGNGAVFAFAALAVVGIAGAAYYFVDPTPEATGYASSSATPPPTRRPALSAPTHTASAAPSAAPPAPPLPLVGVWKSSKGRELVATWKGTRFEVTSDDPDTFPGQGYEKGEVRFVLFPSNGELYVADRLRPKHAAYDLSRSRASCLLELTEVNGKRLRARLEGDTLTVELAQISQVPGIFVIEGGKAVGCRGLARAPLEVIESVLTRQ